MKALGIDIGGSGIKAAVVDIAKGELLTERERLEAPEKSTPSAVVEVIRQLVEHFKWQGPIGIGFPGVVRNDVIHTATNLDDEWIGKNIAALVTKATKCPAHVVNDADAAGLAEAAYGAAKNRRGTILLITLGTGIGSALIHNGRLVPNSEFGQLEFRGGTTESYAAASVRKQNDMRWGKWSKRVNRVLLHLDGVLSPELIILGGGASSKFEKMAQQFDKSLPVVPAQMLNNAGIVGAALAATHDLPEPDLKVHSFRAPRPDKTAKG